MDSYGLDLLVTAHNVDWLSIAAQHRLLCCNVLQNDFARFASNQQSSSWVPPAALWNESQEVGRLCAQDVLLIELLDLPKHDLVVCHDDEFVLVVWVVDDVGRYEVQSCLHERLSCLEVPNFESVVWLSTHCDEPVAIRRETHSGYLHKSNVLEG